MAKTRCGLTGSTRAYGPFQPKSSPPPVVIVMAITRCGLTGSARAYGPFQPKSSLPAVVIVMASTVILVVPDIGRIQVRPGYVNLILPFD